MVTKRILFVGELRYATPEEFTNVDYGKEVIEKYSSNQQIPIRIIGIGDCKKPSCIIVAGDGALYQWQIGQRVELGMAQWMIVKYGYFYRLKVGGVDPSAYKEFTLFNSITARKNADNFTDKETITYIGIISFGLFMEGFNYINDKYHNRMNKKNLIRSVEIKLEDQFRENWGWENSSQRYELDEECQSMEYFQSMDDEEQLYLSRKIENFFEERGVSTALARNFAMLVQDMRNREEQDNGYQESESYVY